MTMVFEQRFRKFDVVVCDIDGCLLDELNPEVDLVSLYKIAEHNQKAEELRDRPYVTLCSGRPQPFVECLSRIIGNYKIPCISENGVWIHNPADNSIECDASIQADDIAATHRLEALVRRFVQDGAIIQAGKSASVSVIHQNSDWIERHVRIIQDLCNEHKLPFKTSRTWSCINCNLSKVNKSTGMKRLIKKLGLQKERLVGIGDTMGDLGIAENVGFFCCPNNAEEKIKTYADFVAQKKICEGVVELLAHLQLL